MESCVVFFWEKRDEWLEKKMIFFFMNAPLCRHTSWEERIGMRKNNYFYSHPFFFFIEIFLSIFIVMAALSLYSFHK